MDEMDGVVVTDMVVAIMDCSVMTMTAEPAGISNVRIVLPSFVSERAMEEGGASVPDSNVPM